MEEIETTPSKRTKVASTSPIDVATLIRKKYQRMQQRHSPLSATACRLLLRKLCPAQDSPNRSLTISECEITTSHLERLWAIVKERYPELRIEENIHEQWIVISR